MAQRNRVRVELNLRGVNEVMKSEGVERELKRRADMIAASAGDGFDATSNNDHPWVARAYAVARTAEARRAEARENVLTRSLGAGRG